MKSVNIFLSAAAICVSVLQAQAVDYDEYFADSTLRADYVLSGKPGNVGINLKCLHKSPVWGGRRGNLDKLPLAGNCDVTVTAVNGDTIYRNSFSTLFNEWLDLNEEVPTTTECPVLLPYPKQPVNVAVAVYDKRRNKIAEISHQVDPNDILIRDSKTPALPHKYISQGTKPGPHVGVAFLAEGYQAEEMDVFYEDCHMAVEAILSHAPFSELSDAIDFIAIETPSKDSGVSIPKNNDWRDTYFKSHFSTFYSDRYLTSPEVFAMYDALRGIPAQHIIVLVNTPQYGGGGIYNNYTLTSAHHATARPVVVHEFGHSFGGLGDEYFYDNDTMSGTYPTDIEPWEPNVTALVDFDSKWAKMLAPGTPVPTPATDAEKYPVGVYEGAAYSSKGLYRPADNCRMRINQIDHFCPVCVEALRNIINFYTEE